MLVTVATVFALFWLPLHVIKLHMIFGPKPTMETKATFDVIWYVLTPLFQWLGSATSAINPFIYCYFSLQFRKYIFELLGVKCASDSGVSNSKGGDERTKYTQVNSESDSNKKTAV